MSTPRMPAVHTAPYGAYAAVSVSEGDPAARKARLPPLASTPKEARRQRPGALGALTKYLTAGVVILCLVLLANRRPLAAVVSSDGSASVQCPASTGLQPVVCPTRPAAAPLTRCARRPPYQHNASLWDRYMDYYENVDGTVYDIHVHTLRVITEAQRDLCITGTVGEIGVMYGKFFFNLAAQMLEREQLVAFDLFELQELNVDHSGGRETDKKEVVIRHGTAIGHDMSRVRLISADSTTLSPQQLLGDMGLSPFRLFSVDGGHTYETTISDMGLAACTLAEGGVFVVDDFGNADWMGVIDAVTHFNRVNNKDFAPFLWSCNKIYFAQASYHAYFLAAVRASKCFPCDMDLKHESRYSLAGWKMCITHDACEANNMPMPDVRKRCMANGGAYTA